MDRLHRRLLWMGALAALLAPGACTAIDAWLDRPPVIAEFSVAPAAVDGGAEVWFRWRISGAPGETLSAWISIDGEGRRDLAIGDPHTVTNLAYTYTNAGTFRARLHVSDGRFESAREVSVTVSGPIRIEVRSPAPDASVDDPLAIEAWVRSEFEIASVEAQIDETMTALIFAGAEADGALFRGLLALSGEPAGTNLIRVRARDVRGNEAAAQRQVDFNHAPQVLLAEPRDEAVATPRRRVRVSCADSDGEACTVTLRGGRTSWDAPMGMVLASAAGDLDADVDFTPLGEGASYLVASAVDSGGRAASPVTIRIHVLNEARWERVIEAPGFIADADATRILWCGEELFDERYRAAIGLFERASGAAVTFPVTGTRNVPIDAYSALLTPTGATFYTINGPGALHQTVDQHDWDGVMLTHRALGFAGPNNRRFRPRELANGAWRARVQAGALGQDQLFVGPTDGELRALTDFGSEAASIGLEALSAGGEVVFVRGERRYRVGAAQPLDGIGVADGLILRIDGAWHLALGRELFRFAP